MLSPQQIESFAAYLFDVYGEIEIGLIENVAAMFRLESLPELAGMEKWYFDILAEAGALRTKNTKLIARYTKRTDAEIANMLQNAGYKSVEYDERLYERAFKLGAPLTRPEAVNMSPRLSQIIGAAARNMRGEFNMVNTVALESASEAFIKIANAVMLEASTGISTLQTATSRAVQRMAKEGITAVRYRRSDGRMINYHVDTAVRRMVLTTTGQMAGNIQMERAREWGSNLVEVSSHAAARPSHAVWQGRVYSIEGSTPKYPNLVEVTGFGSVTGLKGANCAHEIYPFIEGISERRFAPTQNAAQNERQYNNTQELRKLEREKRELKRREAAAAAAKDEEQLKRIVKKLDDKNGEIRQFVKANDLTRRRSRESIA